MSSFTKNINTAANSDFLSAFIRAAAGTNEANSLVTKNGTLSAEGMARIQNALFELAYHDQTLTEQFSEGDESPLRNVIRAMMNVAPVAAQISEGIKAGDFYAVDFAEDIVEAEKFLKDLKQNPKYENETRKAAEHYELYPGTMLGAVPDYLKKLEIAMDENIRSGRNLSYLLNRVLEGVKNMGDPNQVDMFGGMHDLSTEEAVNEQKEKIVDRAIKTTEEWKAQRAEEAKRYSSRDAAYMPLAEKSVNGTATEEDAWKNEDIRYSSRVADESTLDFLNGQKTMKVYRAMQVIDGKLYPPMAAKVKDENGKWSLQEPTEIGAWYQSEERPDLADENGFFVLNKGNGTSLKARYNPYWHTSATPLNDQFSSAYNRPNLVTVEGEIPVSELTSGYRAEKAKDSVGETKWHAGPVASKLKGDKARRVYLSRWFKATRVVPDSEVAQIIAETLKGEDISVPSNVVTPSLLAELRKQGVPIEEIEGKGGIAEDRYSRRGPAKYAPRDIANVTEKDYNDHAWTYYNKVLDNHALSVFSNAISDIKNGFRYPKTWDGKYIIPTGADNGIYNQLVVTNGRYGNASIEAVINIGLNNETELAPIRRAINDYLKEGFSYDEVDSIIEAIKGQGILSLHRQEDFPSLQALRRQRRDSGKADSSDRAMQDGAGSVGENRTVLSDTRITDTQAPDNGAFSSPENRRSSRADSDIALWNPPDVDTRGIYEAVKNGSGKVDGRFDVTVDAGNNGFNVTIKDTQTGETYKDGATVDAGENAEAFAERYIAAIIRNIKSGRPESTSRSTAGIYIEKGENPVRDVNIPVFDVNGDKVRRFMRTVEESGAIPDDMVDDIKKDIMAGGESYKPISNKSALAAFQQNGKRRPRSKLPGVLIRFSAETAPLPSSACRAR